MTARKVSILAIPALLLGLVAWWLFWGQGSPSIADGTETGFLAADEIGGSGAGRLNSAGDGSGGRLESGDQRRALMDQEADYAAALAGFKGRLIDERRQPMTARIVRFYRLDAEIMQNPGLFAGADATIGPKVEIHEVESDEEGRFLVTGVWPHSFYIMEADAEGDNRLTQPVERLPGPGEIVDLGDITLKQLGVIVGWVIDRSGQGVPGVTVRAMDIPGSFLDLVPVERFDPEGAVIIRFSEKPTVIEMPDFVKRYYDMIIRPRTVTLSDGRFRLGGVQPGLNVMAFNKRGLVPRTRKGIKVKAAEERDVGDVKMSEGEEALVKVIDTNEEAVAKAEVLIGATTLMFPVDFAFRAGETDAKGEIYVTGIPAGKVTVAARRTKSHPWVIGTPVNVASDVIIKLPSRHYFDLTISSSVGQKIVNPDFKLMPAMDGNSSLDVGALGFVKWLDLDDRVAQQKDGSYRIKDLIAGSYTLAVCAPGHGAAKMDFKISANAKGEITLNPESRFTVLVTNNEGAPVRRARIYIQSPRSERGDRLLEMPIVAGETDKHGRLDIRAGQAGEVRLSASHPAYGYAHAEAKLPVGDPIVIQMEAPGELIGRLTEGGRVATPGKWTVVLEPRRRGGTRGAMPDMPKLTVPNLDGDFHARGLRPGQYRLRVIRSIKAMTSPGGMIGFMMRARLMREDVTKDVVIEPGQPVYVELDAIKPPESIDGPSARVSGMVLVNGRAGKGMMVTARGERRYGVTADATGRFDLGLVPVGSLQVSVRDPAAADVLDMRMEGHIWRDQVIVKAGVDVFLDIDVAMGSISGIVRLSTGAPAKSIKVKAHGRTDGASEKAKPRTSVAFVLTDQQGRFEFDKLPKGTYRLEASDRLGGYGSSEDVTVLSGGLVPGVNITLAKVHTVSGRVDLSVLGDQPPRWSYLRLRQDGGTMEESTGVRQNGSFRVRGLPPGVYKVSIFVPNPGGRPTELSAQQTVVITDRDLNNLVLTPVIEPAAKSAGATQKGGENRGGKPPSKQK